VSPSRVYELIQNAKFQSQELTGSSYDRAARSQRHRDSIFTPAAGMTFFALPIPRSSAPLESIRAACGARFKAVALRPTT
jgi:hypothetical protein